MCERKLALPRDRVQGIDQMLCLHAVTFAHATDIKSLQYQQQHLLAVLMGMKFVMMASYNVQDAESQTNHAIESYGSVYGARNIYTI